MENFCQCFTASCIKKMNVHVCDSSSRHHSLKCRSIILFGVILHLKVIYTSNNDIEEEEGEEEEETLFNEYFYYLFI